MDITAWIANAVIVAGVSLRLMLGVIGGESDFNLTAERWGTRTQEALIALEAGDHDKLRHILKTEGLDISFGPGQRIIAYHYFGDKSYSLENVLAVRAYVFANPERDILEMAKWLHDKKAAILAGDRDLSRVNGDVDLATAISYNHGRYPGIGDSYWRVWRANIQRYQASFADVDRKIADMLPERAGTP